MTKYKEYFQKMIDENKELFVNFQKIHDLYNLEEEKWQEEFNKQGERVMTIIRHYEDKLCARSEANGYASFTGGLAEKFQEEIRKVYPRIDSVGIVVKYSHASDFQIKKINLS
jgi:hypothetical protein